MFASSRGGKNTKLRKIELLLLKYKKNMVYFSCLYILLAIFGTISQNKPGRHKGTFCCDASCHNVYVHLGQGTYNLGILYSLSLYSWWFGLKRLQRLQKVHVGLYAMGSVHLTCIFWPNCPAQRDCDECDKGHRANITILLLSEQTVIGMPKIVVNLTVELQQIKQTHWKQRPLCWKSGI